MKIEVNIDKRYFLIIISLIGILGVVLITNAYGEGTPQIVGHSWTDIGDKPESFADGEIHWNEVNDRPSGLDDGDDNTNAQTECSNEEYLRGDGNCRNADQIISDSNSGTSGEWPDGHYCIVKRRGESCPQGFQLDTVCIGYSYGGSSDKRLVDTTRRGSYSHYCDNDDQRINYCCK